MRKMRPREIIMLPYLMHNDDFYTWKELYFAPTKKLPLFKRKCVYTYTYYTYTCIYIYLCIFHLKINSKPPLSLHVHCSLQRILLMLQVLLRPELGVCTERGSLKVPVFFFRLIHIELNMFERYPKRCWFFHYKWWRKLMIKLWCCMLQQKSVKL